MRSAQNLRYTVRVSAWTLATAMLFASGSAWAQEAAPPASGQSGQPATANQAASANTQADAQSQQTNNVAAIIVTAQKRKQRILDVPVSVNAVTSEQVNRERIYSLSDLSRAVPSVSSSGAIRGIATNGAARSSAGAVAVLLDGVDLGPPSVGSPQISNLFDVARIEVLSGPQGTLFGTTASAGVINVITNAPNPNKFEVIGRAELAEYGFQREQLTVNVPLASDLAVRISGHNDQSHGIVRNTILNEVPTSFDRGLRGRLLWEPSSNLTFNLIADYDRAGGNGLFDLAYAIAPTAELQARLAECGIVASLNNRENCARGISSISARETRYGFSGQVDLAVGADTLTSITAYRRHKRGSLNYNGLGGDSDLLSDNILDTNLTPEDLQTTSEEIRLASPSDQRLEYTLGLYYFDKKQKDSVIQAGQLGDLGALLSFFFGYPPGSVFGRVNKLHIGEQTYAAFGQATYHLTPQFSLIAGARYSDDKVTDVSTSLTPATTPSLTSYGYVFYPGFFLEPVNARVKVHNFSWKLGVQYQWSRQLMAYFTATRGYKGPAVNDQASPPIAIPIIQPEIPMAYELGFKGAFLGGRVLSTLAIFYNKDKNFQTSVYVPPSATSPAGSFAQGNAPFIKSRGVDFNITARPTDELTLVGGVLYNRATYASSFLVACNPTQLPGSGTCSSGGTTSPVSQLAMVPKWRLLLNGEYAKQVSPGASLFLQADATYESRQFAGATPDPVTDIHARTLLNGRIGIRDPDRRWSLSVFGNNLLNTKLALLSEDPLGGFNGGGGRSYWVTPARGRTFGGTFDFHF